MTRKRDQEQIFAIAAEIQDAELRSAYLADVCGEDTELHAAIDKLLKHDCEADSFLDMPLPTASPTLDLPPITEQVGAQVGAYKLMEQIGEGGMGVVYVARQERPILRKVALKIIKPGMDTKEVIARFEAERQALALMDHPNIAKVLDAGTTESGRPYFAMELVRGIPITDYCDRKRLTTRQRLQLFVATCQAIQHAHQKGVIHRDVKPSNVLVTEHDGTPLPKVIDFGVAKAINQRLTERTIYTRHQQMIGTPLYMSPEQADLSALDVDTRTDIYSLGVLLYELLTGVTPFDERRFRKAAYDEMRRIIREEEPPKPSTRISTLGDSASTFTEHRQTDPKRLRQVLRGELDWIVMKALEKDRSRRYETANGLAADVDRYLCNETVTACPPSAAYRFHKFARRNKGSLMTVTVIGAVLLVATLVSVRQASVARNERNNALALIHELRAELEEKVFLAIMAGDEGKAEKAIEQAQAAGVSQQKTTLFRGQLALYYGRAEEAIAKLQEVSDQSIAAQGMLATACSYAQDLAAMDRALTALAAQLEQAGEDLTFEDKLFAGQAMINSDMVAGGKLVEQALQERSTSPLAQMIHAVTLAAFAHNTGEIEMMKPALDEIKAAMRWVGDTPCLLSAHHMVQFIAHTFGMDHEAGIDIEQLHADWDKIKELPAGRTMLVRLLASLDDPEVPQRIKSRRSITAGEMGFYIPILLNYEPPTAVLAFLREHQHKLSLEAQASRARVMALLPTRRAEAKELCIELANKDHTFYTRIFCLNTLLLLGKVEEVQSLARDLFASTTAPIWYRAEVMRFLAAPGGSNEEFLAGAGQVRVHQLAARLTIGMLQLAKGKREEALETLRRCDETQASHSEDFWWARALVTAMDGGSMWTLETPADSE